MKMKIERFVGNNLLSENDKKKLINDDALLIGPFGDSTQKAYSLFDQCIIGTTGGESGNLLAIYHFEKLVVAHWWLFHGDGSDFDIDNWESADFSSNKNEDDDEEYDSGYFSAYDFVSSNYLSGFRPGNYPVIVEENPDLVCEIEEGLHDDNYTLIQIGDKEYVFV
jgi:hypothetical protein